jgi:hypothetical protein
MFFNLSKICNKVKQVMINEHSFSNKSRFCIMPYHLIVLYVPFARDRDLSHTEHILFM